MAAAQCATRATDFVIADLGLFEYRNSDRVAGVRSEGGITRWRSAERWFIILPPSGSEYTPVFELVQWRLRHGPVPATSGGSGRRGRTGYAVGLFGLVCG